MPNRLSFRFCVSLTHSFLQPHTEQANALSVCVGAFTLSRERPISRPTDWHGALTIAGHSLGANLAS